MARVGGGWTVCHRGLCSLLDGFSWRWREVAADALERVWEPVLDSCSQRRGQGFAALSTACDDHSHVAWRLVHLGRRRRGYQRRPAGVCAIQRDECRRIVGVGCGGRQLESGWTGAVRSCHGRRCSRRRRHGAKKGRPGAKASALSCGLWGMRRVLYGTVAGWWGRPGLRCGRTAVRALAKREAHNLLYCT